MQLWRAVLCALCLAGHAGAARHPIAARAKLAAASRRGAKAAAATAPVKLAASASKEKGGSGSQGCWKANSLCESMRDYVRSNGITHIFVGASAKLAGTTIKHYMQEGRSRPDKLHRNPGLDADSRAMLRQRCQWNVAGSHMWAGLGSVMTQPCAPKTLFLLPMREEIPWIRSALQQVCWHRGWKPGTRMCEEEICPQTCGNTNWLKRALRMGWDELSMGPHNWIKEWMVRSPKFHTFMYDISATDDVLACLPPGGLKIENSSELARHVYKRPGPIHTLNSGALKGPSFINISDDAILAEYNAGPYWVEPYAKAIKESGCEAASAQRLQATEVR